MNADFDYLNRLGIGFGLFENEGNDSFGYYGNFYYGWKNVLQSAPNPGQYKFQLFTIGNRNSISMG